MVWLFFISDTPSIPTRFPTSQLLTFFDYLFERSASMVLSPKAQSPGAPALEYFAIFSYCTSKVISPSAYSHLVVFIYFQTIFYLPKHG